MGTFTKVSKKEIKKALEDAGGMPTKAAQLLNVTYLTIYRQMLKYPELQEARNSARAKLHEDSESLILFAIKTGFIQRAKIGDNGKPTAEIEYVEVDQRTRLDKAVQLMSMYNASVGLKNNIDITTNGKKIKGGGITIIELPEHLRPKDYQEENQDFE